MTEQHKPQARPQGAQIGTGDLLGMIGELTVENRVMRQTITDLSGRLAAAMKDLDGLKDVKPTDKQDGK